MRTGIIAVSMGLIIALSMSGPIIAEGERYQCNCQVGSLSFDIPPEALPASVICSFDCNAYVNLSPHENNVSPFLRIHLFHVYDIENPTNVTLFNLWGSWKLGGETPRMASDTGQVSKFSNGDYYVKAVAISHGKASTTRGMRAVVKDGVISDYIILDGSAASPNDVDWDYHFDKDLLHSITASVRYEFSPSE